MNKVTQWKTLRYLACGLVLLATPALAVDSSLASASPGVAQTGEVPLAGDNWIDHFDTYATGSQMHGQGGWVGWDNAPAAGALTSSAQARSPLNSVDILGASDLVQIYTGHTGTWTYTAWQYLPSSLSGITYFIMLNTYNHGGPYNWSIQVNFDGATDTVTNDGVTGGTLPIIYDQWVEIRVVIDLVADVQTFYYGGQVLYTGTWTGEVSGGGLAQIAAVDLFANGASSAFYDDISMSDLPFLDGFETESTVNWHSTLP
ncbi:MAG: hypothetical protein F9K18_15335 [Thermoanaerobaculia bacterium]|nr:MAG: hypothetical protein F9K18_15335 [Thermoanaerobaculia bacterium]